MDDDVKPDDVKPDDVKPDDAADLGESDPEGDLPVSLHSGSGYVVALPPAVTYRLTRAGDPPHSINVPVL